MTDDYFDEYDAAYGRDYSGTTSRSYMPNAGRALDSFFGNLRTRARKPLPDYNALAKITGGAPTYSPFMPPVGRASQQAPSFTPAGPPQRYQVNLLGEAVGSLAESAPGAAFLGTKGAVRGGVMDVDTGFGRFGLATVPVNMQNFATYAREAPIAAITSALGHHYQQPLGTDPYAQPAGPQNRQDIFANMSEGDFEGVLDNVIDGVAEVGNAIAAPFVAITDWWRRSDAVNRGKGIRDLALSGATPGTWIARATSLFDDTRFDWEKIAAAANAQGIRQLDLAADLWDLDPQIVDAIFANPNMTDEELDKIVDGQPFSYDPGVNVLVELGVNIAPLVAGGGLVRGTGFVAQGIAGGARALGGAAELATGGRLSATAARTWVNLERLGVIGRPVATADALGARTLVPAWRAVRAAGLGLEKANRYSLIAGSGIRVGEWGLKQTFELLGADEAAAMMDQWLWEMPLSNNPGLMLVDGFAVHPLRTAKSIYRGTKEQVSVRLFGGEDLAVSPVAAKRIGSIAEMPMETVQERLLDRLGWDADAVARVYGEDGPLSLTDLKNGLLYFAQQVVRDRREASARYLEADGTIVERNEAFWHQYGEEAVKVLQSALTGRGPDADAIANAVKEEFWNRANVTDASELGAEGYIGPYDGTVSFAHMASWIRASKLAKQVQEDAAVALRADVNTTFLSEFRTRIRDEYKSPDAVISAVDLNTLRTQVPASVNMRRGILKRRGERVPKVTRRQLEALLTDLESRQAIADMRDARPETTAVPAIRPDQLENRAAIAKAFKLRQDTIDRLIDTPPEELAGPVPPDLGKVLVDTFHMTEADIRRSPDIAWSRAAEWWQRMYASAAARGDALDAIDRFAKVVGERFAGMNDTALDAEAFRQLREAVTHPYTRDEKLGPTALAIAEARDVALSEFVDRMSGWLDDPARGLRLTELNDGTIVVIEKPGFQATDVIVINDLAGRVPATLSPEQLAILADPNAHPLEKVPALRAAVVLDPDMGTAVQRGRLEEMADLSVYDEDVKLVLGEEEVATRDTVATLHQRAIGAAEELVSLREQIRSLAGIIDRSPTRQLSGELTDFYERAAALGERKIGKAATATVETWRTVPLDAAGVVKALDLNTKDVAIRRAESRVKSATERLEAIDDQRRRISQRGDRSLIGDEVEWGEPVQRFRTRKEAQDAAKDARLDGNIYGVSKVGSRWGLYRGTLRDAPEAQPAVTAPAEPAGPPPAPVTPEGPPRAPFRAATEYGEGVEYVPTEVLRRFIEVDRETTPIAEGATHLLDELTEDIRANGIKEPATLVYDPITNSASISDGNHRLAAAVRLGLPELPVKAEVIRRTVKEQEAVDAGDLTPPQGFHPADRSPGFDKPFTLLPSHFVGKLDEPPAGIATGKVAGLLRVEDLPPESQAILRELYPEADPALAKVNALPPEALFEAELNSLEGRYGRVTEFDDASGELQVYLREWQRGDLTPVRRAMLRDNLIPAARERLSARETAPAAPTAPEVAPEAAPPAAAAPERFQLEAALNEARQEYLRREEAGERLGIANVGKQESLALAEYIAREQDPPPADVMTEGERAFDAIYNFGVSDTGYYGGPVGGADFIDTRLVNDTSRAIRDLAESRAHNALMQSGIRPAWVALGHRLGTNIYKVRWEGDTPYKVGGDPAGMMVGSGKPMDAYEAARLIPMTAKAVDYVKSRMAETKKAGGAVISKADLAAAEKWLDSQEAGQLRSTMFEYEPGTGRRLQTRQEMIEAAETPEAAPVLPIVEQISEADRVREAQVEQLRREAEAQEEALAEATANYEAARVVAGGEPSPVATPDVSAVSSETGLPLRSWDELVAERQALGAKPKAAAARRAWQEDVDALYREGVERLAIERTSDNPAAEAKLAEGIIEGRIVRGTAREPGEPSLLETTDASPTMFGAEADSAPLPTLEESVAKLRPMNATEIAELQTLITKSIEGARETGGRSRKLDKEVAAAQRELETKTGAPQREQARMKKRVEDALRARRQVDMAAEQLWNDRADVLEGINHGIGSGRWSAQLITAVNDLSGPELVAFIDAAAKELRPKGRLNMGDASRWFNDHFEEIVRQATDENLKATDPTVGMGKKGQVDPALRRGVYRKARTEALQRWRASSEGEGARMIDEELALRGIDVRPADWPLKKDATGAPSNAEFSDPQPGDSIVVNGTKYRIKDVQDDGSIRVVAAGGNYKQRTVQFVLGEESALSFDPDVPTWRAERAGAQPSAPATADVSAPAPEPVVFLDPADNRTPIASRVVLVEADALLTSDQPGFPPNLQPRSRGVRASSDEQILEYAQDIQPDKLIGVTEGASGMPVVSPDGAVVAGNGRTMALRLAKQPQYSKYKVRIQAEAGKYGFDVAQVNAMRRPMLVRELVDVAPADMERLAWQLNEMPIGDLAPSVAAALTRGDIRAFKVGDEQSLGDAIRSPANTEAVARMIGRLPRDWHSRFYDSKTGLNEPGAKLLEAVLLSKLLRADDRARPGFQSARSVVFQIAEQGGEDIRRISGGLAEGAGQLVKAYELAESGALGPDVLTLGDDLAPALARIIELRDTGLTMEGVQNALDNTTMFEAMTLTPVQTHLAKLLAQSTTQKEVRTFMRGVADAAEQGPAAGQELMFADVGQLDYTGMLNEGVRAWNAERVAQGRPEIDYFPSTEAPYDVPLGTGVSESAIGTTEGPARMTQPLAAEEVDAEIAARTVGEQVVEQRMDPADDAIDAAAAADFEAFSADVADLVETFEALGRSGTKAGEYSSITSEQMDGYAQLLESANAGEATPAELFILAVYGGGIRRNKAGQLNMTFGGWFPIDHGVVREPLSGLRTRFAPTPEDAAYVAQLNERVAKALADDEVEYAATKKRYKGKEDQAPASVRNLWQRVERQRENAAPTARVIRGDPQQPVTAEELAQDVGPDVNHAPDVPAVNEALAAADHTLVVGDNPTANRAVRRAVGAPKVEDSKRRVYEVHAPDAKLAAERIEQARQEAQAEVYSAENALEEARDMEVGETERASVFPDDHTRELWDRLMRGSDVDELAAAMGSVEPTSLAQVIDAIESIDRGVYADPRTGVGLEASEAMELRTHLMRLANGQLEATLDRQGVRRTERATAKLGTPPDDFEAQALQDRAKIVMDELGEVVKVDPNLPLLEGFLGAQYVLSKPPTKAKATGGGTVPPRLLFTDRFAGDVVPGLLEELEVGRMEDIPRRIANARLARILDTIAGPRPEKEIRTQAISNFTRELTNRVDPDLFDDVEAKKVERVVETAYASWRDHIEQVKPIGGFQLYRRIHLMGAEALNRMFDDAVREVYGDVTPAWRSQMALDGVSPASAWRRADNRIRQSLLQSGMPLSTGLEKLYGRAADLGEKPGRWLTVAYHFGRFLMDVRWLALEAIEPFMLTLPRGGIGPVLEASAARKVPGVLAAADKVRMTESTKQPLAFGLEQQQIAFREFAHWANVTDIEQGTATRHRYLVRELVREQRRPFREVVKTMMRNDPQLRRIVDDADDGNVDAFLARLDRDWQLAEQNTREFRTVREAEAFFRPWLEHGVIDERTYREFVAARRYTAHPAIEAELARTVGEPAVQATLERLAAINQDLFHNLTATFFGQENRSNLQRLANHPLLFWPISYQIKATKWLLRGMFDEFAGVDTGATVAGAFQRVHDEHRRRFAEDPRYRAKYEANRNLYFMAGMLFPIIPTELGVSMSPWTRMLLYPDYERAGGIFGVGPVYTNLSLVPRLIAEQTKQGGLLAENEELAGALQKAFPQTVTIGRDRPATSQIDAENEAELPPEPVALPYEDLTTQRTP